MNLELFAGLLVLANAFFWIGAAPIFMIDMPKLIAIVRERHPEVWEELGRPGRLLSSKIQQSRNLQWFVLDASYSKGSMASDGELRDIGDRLRILAIVGGLLMFALIPVMVLSARQKFGG